MKIYNKPTKQHIQEQEQKTPHISHTQRGYIIRKTINETTYYYGCYKTLKEAQTIEQQLKQHGYTPRLSNNLNKRRGQEYTEWLKEKINKQ